MRNLIEKSACSNVLLAGDLNAHFNRLTSFTNIIIKSEFEDLELNLLWKQPDTTDDYTYCSMQNDNVYFSTLEHFAVSQGLMESIINAGVIHFGENQSSYSAIFLKFNTAPLNLSLEKPCTVKRACWSKASADAKELFKSSFSSKLNEIASYDCVQ